MISFVLWYVVLALVGVATFPLAYRFLPSLPDRGYTLARALGLLVWGYLFWLLTSLGALQNNSGGILTAFLLVVACSIYLGWKDRFSEMLSWLRDHRQLILTSEILFLAAFALMAFIRAANPEISGTEKPMELAFINAILHSPTFPPHDPWLSGYAISYYYFGYVLVAMLCRITGVTSGVGFNLALALWFALTALGAYGVLYNLLDQRKIKAGLLAAPILGPLFILIVSNYEGFLDVLHGAGVFWQRMADGTLTSSFWKWLDITELTAAPQTLSKFPWLPTRPGGIVWWQASRVVLDRTFDLQPREIIDEFPFFSYLLGDLHPHVLAMPFALLLVGLALNLYLGWSREQFKLFSWTIPMGKASFLLSAVLLGGMAFLNTWDFPIYVGLVTAAFSLAAYIHKGWSKQLVKDFLMLGLSLGIAGLILYLPFFLGFSSQAGGFLPSLVFSTRGVQFWVMFGPLLIPILLFLIYLVRQRRPDLKQVLRVSAWVLGSLAGLLLLSFLFAFAISKLPGLGMLFLQNLGALQAGITSLLADSLLRRIEAPGTWLTLGAILVLILVLFRRDRPQSEIQPEGSLEPLSPEQPVRKDGFVLLLVMVGGLLTLVPEFFYLRDQFGWRINTIFKFYFQAWILWAIAAAYASTILWQSLKGARRAAYRIGWALVVGATLVYPAFGLYDKTSHFSPAAGLTLDGNAYIERYSPDEMAAIQWLQTAPPGILAEAVGGSYTAYARISIHSGQPTVLGWPGHVSQWRGGGKEMGSREADIEKLYRTGDWNEALSVIRQYNIRYIYIGDLERTTYKVNEVKFQQHLRPIYQKGSVVIYEAPVMDVASVTTVGIGKP